jgi:hypothetical protein
VSVAPWIESWAAMELRRCHGCQEGAPSIGGSWEALEGKECSALDKLRAMGPKEEGAMGGEEAPCARLCGMRSVGRGGRLKHREGRCLLEEEEGEEMRSRTALL